MPRPAIQRPGQRHPHDDLEEIWVEVMHQERLAQTIASLDREIERDERRAKAQTPPAQAAKRTAPARTKPRARDQRSAPRLRNPRARKGDEQGDHDRARYAAGIVALLSATLVLATVGAIFAIIVRLVRVLL